MNISRSLKLRDRYVSHIMDVYNRAEVYHLSSSQIQEKLVALVWGDEAFRRLPQWVKSYCFGVSDTCSRYHQRSMVYSYVVDGVRLSIESDEYKAVSPEYIHRECSDSGALSYRDDINAIFSGGEKS